MRKITKKFLLCCLCIAMILFSAAGCVKTSGGKDDIIVLFTNDVHCGVDDNIGYAGLAAYKKTLEKTNKYVTLVDCGDFTQGDYLGAISKGKYIVDIMNEVGYDFVTLGNHEFDYGMDQLAENIGRLEAKTLCCNITYSGKNENKLTGVSPYAIVSYGKIKVGYIGIATPKTRSSSTSTFFKEDDKYVYSFGESEDGKLLYDAVQKTIDQMKKKGTDYIVAMAHLGLDEEENDRYSSLALIRNTTGIDVLLDAHTHSEVPSNIVKNKDGKAVLVSQTGTKLSNIGQLTISPNGFISVGYISSYEDKDEDVAAVIAEKKEETDNALNKVLGSTESGLGYYDENGKRLVRVRETALGDFISDAFRVMGNGQIGLINGGALREEIKPGNVTYKDLITTMPFTNYLCTAKIKGQQILDLLEFTYRNVPAEYFVNGAVVGESGDFMQVSGLRLSIDTNIPSSVIMDENEMLIRVTGERRVMNVEVYDEANGYVPLDPDKEYVVAATDYILKNGGAGTEHLFKDIEIDYISSEEPYITIGDYVKKLGGNLAKYGSTDNRITVIK